MVLGTGNIKIVASNFEVFSSREGGGAERRMIFVLVCKGHLAVCLHNKYT